jgi:hypothetical protein
MGVADRWREDGGLSGEMIGSSEMLDRHLSELTR